ncbi:hypothetical protein E1B28_013519 [Marasmius oreades]|uniref:Protein artemis n=1 Tax=Marasmius oreades TaxID=181124 RepID=A0A9P7RPZ7_9AGAR|nr:uncharacterized protein E1B28_013519 [Marasmius oreades]KAG7087564.1 hypothetical protein E1B28_013519 [Marasmius oreades]
MPPGAPFHSFVLPYPIRIDEFTELPTTRDPNDPTPTNAKLYFLTHTHSDHLLGLQAKGFAQKVYCSQDAKQMLLRIEEFQERSLRDKGYRAEPTRKYRHLQVNPIYDSTGHCINEPQVRNLLKTCPMNLPFEVQYAEGEEVVITAIDANHCPGSVMYLIEGPQGSILHTGDFRAEPWFLETIKRNPFLQPYLASEDTPLQENELIKTLEAIYLDTACVMQTHQVPSKESAISGLINLMRLYPPSTLFFINAWTPGYEDILKAIARAFGSKVHLDRYKHNIYGHLRNDPLLASIGTSDPESTRFHACERFDRCHVVSVQQGEASTRTKDNRRVVYVNPVSSMTPELWAKYQSDTRARLNSVGAHLRDEECTCLLVPLSRHSPLPELRSFVSLFRPKRIIPNTLDPKLKALDWLAIERAFADCLASPGKSQHSLIPLPPPIDPEIAEATLVSIFQQKNDVEEDDTALKNFADSTVRSSTAPGSQETRDLAKQWVVGVGYDHARQGRKLKGRMARKAALVMKWLGKDDDEILARLPPLSSRQRERKDAAKAGLALGVEDRHVTSDSPHSTDSPQRSLRQHATSTSSDFDHDEGNDSSDGDDDVHVKVHHQIFGNGCMSQRSSSISYVLENDLEAQSKADINSQMDPEAKLTEPEQHLCPAPLPRAISPLRPKRGGLEPLTPGPESSPFAGTALLRYSRQNKGSDESRRQLANIGPPMHTVAAMNDLDVQEQVEGEVATFKRGVKRTRSKADVIGRPGKRMSPSPYSQKHSGAASFPWQNCHQPEVEDDPRLKSIKRQSALFRESQNLIDHASQDEGKWSKRWNGNEDQGAIVLSPHAVKGKGKGSLPFSPPKRKTTKNTVSTFSTPTPPSSLLKLNATEILPVSFFTDNPMSPLKPNATCPHLSPSPSSRRLTTRSRKAPLSPTSRLRKTQRRMNMCATMQASCSNLVDPSYEEQHIKMVERWKRESFKIESKLQYEQDRRRRFEALPDKDDDPSTDPRMDSTRRDEWIEKIRKDLESGRRINLPAVGRDQ